MAILDALAELGPGAAVYVVPFGATDSESASFRRAATRLQEVGLVDLEIHHNNRRRKLIARLATNNT
jgi:hypothetical protein